jgi:hypothetical protein
MKVSTYLVSLALLPAVTLAACPNFSLESTSCTSGILTSSSVSATCADDVVSVTGDATVSSDFDGETKVTLVPCVRGTGGMMCFDSYKQDAGSICDLISSESVACGAAGDYTISESFTIPEEANKISSMWSLFTIKVYIGDEEACQQEASSSSSSAYLMVGVAGLLGVGGVSFFMRRKRRPLIVLEEDGEGNGQSRFIEMGSAMA